MNTNQAVKFLMETHDLQKIDLYREDGSKAAAYNLGGEWEIFPTTEEREEHWKEFSVATIPERRTTTLHNHVLDQSLDIRVRRSDNTLMFKYDHHKREIQTIFDEKEMVERAYDIGKLSSGYGSNNNHTL